VTLTFPDPKENQRKLFHDNAIRVYRLSQKPKLFLNRFRMLAQQLLSFVSNGTRSTSSTMALPPVTAPQGIHGTP
jgi:hypothetical protein